MTRADMTVPRATRSTPTGARCFPLPRSRCCDASRTRSSNTTKGATDLVLLGIPSRRGWLAVSPR